jgi:hypothetical protein
MRRGRARGFIHGRRVESARLSGSDMTTFVYRLWEFVYRLWQNTVIVRTERDLGANVCRHPVSVM